MLWRCPKSSKMPWQFSKDQLLDHQHFSDLVDTRANDLDEIYPAGHDSVPPVSTVPGGGVFPGGSLTPVQHVDDVPLQVEDVDRNHPGLRDSVGQRRSLATQWINHVVCDRRISPLSAQASDLNQPRGGSSRIIWIGDTSTGQSGVCEEEELQLCTLEDRCICTSKAEIPKNSNR